MLQEKLNSIRFAGRIPKRDHLNKNIFIIDDERVIISALKKAFEKAGYTVNSAVDADSASKAIKENRPDLIIVDLALPNVNGLSFIRSLRSDPSTSSIPIMVYSGFLSIARPELLKLRVEKIVSKPCDLSLMVRYVDNLLGVATPA